MGSAELGNSRISTSDLDSTVAVLNQVYPSRPRLVGDQRGGGTLDISTVGSAGLIADSLRLRMRFDVETDPWAEFTAVWLLDGHVTAIGRSAEHRLTAGDCFLHSVTEGMAYRVQPFDMVVLRLGVEDVANAATRLFGIGPGELRFAADRPVSAPMNAYWRSLSGFVRQTLAAAPSIAENQLVVAQLRDYVASSLLSVFPNTTLQLSYVSAPGDVGPAALRRAVAFVDAGADQPITIEDIAVAAGTTARALQYALRRHLECSPREYLRRVRLERAHRALQAADPGRGDTVAGIARQWGFMSTSWFIRHYRAAYGQPPSHTLRNRG